MSDNPYHTPIDEQEGKSYTDVFSQSEDTTGADFSDDDDAEALEPDGPSQEQMQDIISDGQDDYNTTSGDTSGSSGSSSSDDDSDNDVTSPEGPTQEQMQDVISDGQDDSNTTGGSANDGLDNSLNGDVQNVPLDEDDTMWRSDVTDTPGPIDAGGNQGNNAEANARRELMDRLDSELGYDVQDDDVLLRREGNKIVADLTPEGLAQARVAAGVGSNESPGPTPWRPGSPFNRRNVAGKDTLIYELGERKAGVSPSNPGSPANPLDVDSGMDTVTLEPDEETSAVTGERASAPDIGATGPAFVGRELADQLEKQTGAENLQPGTDFTIKETSQGYQATLTEEGREKVGQPELFGDIPVQNPFTGNRVEEDLRGLSEDYRSATRGFVDVTGTASPPAVTERILLGGLDAAGFDEVADRQRAIGSDPDEGPSEETVEAFARGGANVFNLAELGLGLKEVAEFGLTQPQRFYESVPAGEGTAPSEVVQRGGRGSLGTVGARSGGIRFDEEGAEEFRSDVDQRVDTIVRTFKRDVRERPLQTLPSAAGGLLAGAFVGTAAGRYAAGSARIPVGGSDLSGRVLVAASRTGRRYATDGGSVLRQFVDSDRAQGQLQLKSRSESKERGETDPELGVPDDPFRVSDKRLFDPSREFGEVDDVSRFTDEPSTGSVSSEDIGPGISGRGNPMPAGDAETFADNWNPGGDLLNERGGIRPFGGIASRGGLIGGVLGAGAATASALAAEREAAMQRFDVGSRFDQPDAGLGNRLDFRFDLKQDIGFRTGQGLRQDTRQDARIDTRTDVAADTRQGIRADVGMDLRGGFRMRTDLPRDRGDEGNTQSSQTDAPLSPGDGSGDDPLLQGWYSEFVTAIATGGSGRRGAPESALEEFESPLGEYPTGAQLFGGPETQESIDEAYSLLSGLSGTEVEF